MSLRNNNNFRSITPNEYITEGNLVWIESFKDAYYTTQVEGPFVIVEGWGPIWFGTPNQNKPNHDHVRLVSTVSGEIRQVCYGSFLHETYYVMNEEKLCTDAAIK